MKEKNNAIEWLALVFVLAFLVIVSVFRGEE